MAWPFQAYYRPIMRSVLFYAERMGWDEDEIKTVLTGPKHRHNAADFDAAYREARRAGAFGDFLRAADPSKTPGEVWAGCAGECFRLAYGREPRLPEEAWALTRPQGQLGIMVEITINGVDDYAITPTINVPWDVPIGAVESMVSDWYITGQRSPPPPGSAAAKIAGGASVNVRIKGGALLERIDPTLTVRGK